MTASSAGVLTRAARAVAGRGEADDPTAPLWRGAVVFRVLTLGFALGVQLAFSDGYARPALSWVLVGVMTGWTVLTGVGFTAGWGRTPAVVAADVAVSAVLLAGNRLVLSTAALDAGRPLVTTVWVAGAVVAVAVLAGPWWGFGVAAVVSAESGLVRGYVDTDLARDTTILLCVGVVLGVSAVAARRSRRALERALRTSAAAAERERLGREVHDSVLQALSFISRQGSAMGGGAADLARLAGEQEVALRALVSAGPADADAAGGAEVDLRPLLQAQASASASVSVPSTAVPLPGHVATELAAVARTALTNTAVHAGAGAHAYVLLEDLGDHVVLSVRDDGVGIPEGRLATAEGEGRMGVARSIRGRVAELGGEALLDTAPGLGTEWEVRVPRGTGGRRG
ncbi:MacS family sensor histidine kinase [Rhodococcus aerolatus]